MSEKLKITPCPDCGHHTLDIDMRLTARDLTAFSLSGSQMKVSARFLPWLYCRRASCDFIQQGWIEGKHAVFPELSPAADDEGDQ